MITSKDNEKLKLIRKLAERKHREREGLFVAEGEDLVAAAEAAGGEPRVRAARRRGRRARAARRRLDAGFGHAGDRGLPRSAAAADDGFDVYLHGVGDPGNVGAIIRTAHALLGARVILGPGMRRPVRPQGRAREHGLDLRASRRWGSDPLQRCRRRSSVSSPMGARPPTTSRSAG